ncbi:MAG: UDP-N-acetyl-D-mannosamine dehydrogenase [Clostridia bacterium]|nr:UDP-N-acetyl-D-mannosamine dehydrogenase [Clostridia bacterium]
MEKICVLGLGYIGLPTAAVFASKGFKVYGVDIKKDIIESLRMGRIHIEEPLLTQLVLKTIASGNLLPKEVPEEADVFIIAVPTPKTQENKCELKYVIEAARSIVPYIRKGNIIILESTVTPGTTEEVIKPIIEESGLVVGEEIYLAHCPERVLPGSILDEITKNGRIIGGYTKECASKAKVIYQSFVSGQIILTDLKTAEMTKLVENIFRDVNIAFANELVKVCDALRIDAMEVIELANKHPRVNILQPGPGVGGHCLAIDPYYLISSVPELTKLISTARDINCSMPSFIVTKVEKMLEGIKNPKIVVFGITYKENIGDVRESPSLEVIRILKDKNYEVVVCDPHVQDKLYQLEEIYKSVVGADIIIILVAHDEFKSLDIGFVSQSMRTPLIFDAKNILDQNIYENVTINKLGRVSR